MTIFKQALFAYLSTMGSTAGNRVFPVQLPEKAQLPAITYIQVSDPPEHTQSGPSKLRHPRFQIDCWGTTYLDASNLADEMAALEGFSGSMGSFEVGASFVEDGRDNYDPNSFRHWVSVDVIIWYSK